MQREPPAMSPLFGVAAHNSGGSLCESAAGDYASVPSVGFC